MLKQFLGASLLVFLAFSQAFAGEVVRLTNGEWAPYTSEKLKNYGMFSHIVTEAFALEGFTVEYKFFPWKRSYNLAKQGIFDGSVTWAPTEKRKKDFYFTDSVTFSKKVFFHNKKFNFDWSSLEDLRGIEIGVTETYTYGEEFDSYAQKGFLKVQKVHHDVQNLKKLLSKRIQIFPMEIEVGYSLIRSNLQEDQYSLLTHHPKPVSEFPICVIISRNIESDRAKILIDTFNRGLLRLKKSGRYQEIFNSYRLGRYDR